VVAFGSGSERDELGAWRRAWAAALSSEMSGGGAAVPRRRRGRTSDLTTGSAVSFLLFYRRDQGERFLSEGGDI
jgi:hypothetical protein